MTALFHLSGQSSPPCAWTPFFPLKGSLGCAADRKQPLTHTALWIISVNLGTGISWDGEQIHWVSYKNKAERDLSRPSTPALHLMAGVCLSSPRALWGMRNATQLRRVVLDRMNKPAIKCKLSSHCCDFTPCEPNMQHRVHKCDVILNQAKHLSEV